MSNENLPIFVFLIPDLVPLMMDPVGRALMPMTCCWARAHWPRPTKEGALHLLEAAALYAHKGVLRWLTFYYYISEELHANDSPNHVREHSPELIACATFRALQSGCWGAWRMLCMDDWVEWSTKDRAKTVLLSQPMHLDEWTSKERLGILHILFEHTLRVDDPDLFVYLFPWENPRTPYYLARSPRCLTAFYAFHGPWHPAKHSEIFELVRGGEATFRNQFVRMRQLGLV